MAKFQATLVDKMKKKAPIDLKIGEKTGKDVIELKENNGISFLNYKKFEAEKKEDSTAAKCDCVVKWCKLMI